MSTFQTTLKEIIIQNFEMLLKVSILQQKFVLPLD